MFYVVQHGLHIIRLGGYDSMVGDSLSSVLARAREMCEEDAAEMRDQARMRDAGSSRDSFLAALDKINLQQVLREVEMDGYVPGCRLA